MKQIKKLLKLYQARHGGIQPITIVTDVACLGLTHHANWPKGTMLSRETKPYATTYTARHNSALIPDNYTGRDYLKIILKK